LTPIENGGLKRDIGEARTNGKTQKTGVRGSWRAQKSALGAQISGGKKSRGWRSH